MGSASFNPQAVSDPGLWVNPDYILTANNTRTSINITSANQNKDHAITVAPWLGTIPEGAEVTSAVLQVDCYATNASGLQLLAYVRSGGVALLNRVAITLTNVETLRTLTFQATREQLLDPSLEVTLVARKDGSNSRVHQVDYVRIQAEYVVEQLTWYDGTTEIPATLQGVWDGTNVAPATYDGNSS